jgi:phosphopantothenoylcysteine decarboxylase/phosphopantothenate--cysteine ligase
MSLKGKNVVVGVTGGIAAYKVAELVRILVKADINTRVAMTSNATRFVTPLTFEALSGNRVVCEMFDHGTDAFDHITWGQDTDLIIIAPATANFIAKMTQGIADDFLSTMVIASTAKILLCPSMNSVMFLNPAVQQNLGILKERGIAVMAPGEGELACKAEGLGRLPEPAEIAEDAQVLLSEQDLSGLRLLVTAGPTIEPLDPVRYFTNRSSGKMGYAIARAARFRGATVTLVSGPTNLDVPPGVAFYSIKTTEEMRQAVLSQSKGCDVIIKAAAPLDYRPAMVADHKIKKVEDVESIEMVRTPDILRELGNLKEDSRCLLVGFAAETEDLLSNATEKLRQKNLDMIIANDVSRDDAGFESDTNLIKIIHKNGHREDLPLLTKEEVADQLLDRVRALWENSS